MWDRMKVWFRSWNQTEEEWYLSHSRDLSDLEMRLREIQRADMKRMFWQYYRGE
jgi:hypothetical protein